MSKSYFKALSFLIISAMLVSCAVQKTEKRKIGFKPCKFPAGQYSQKVDNFLVILDASSSMGFSYKGEAKIDLAKDILSRMNQTIPDLEMSAGIRTFGTGILPFGKRTELIYGMKKYSKTYFEKALQSVNTTGASPLSYAINAASEDLKSTQGNTALIIVSDGKEMDNAPVDEARNIKKRLGDRLCIYTVLIGDDTEGKKLMEEISSISECGFSANADDISMSKDMAGFVQKVFLAEAAIPLDNDGDGVPDSLDMCADTPPGVKVDASGCPLDTDGDGVYDYLDKCPDTPLGASVSSDGCPLDSDGDGVYDYLDECPDTPKGASVNEKGCCVIGGATLFDTAKWEIKTQFHSGLDKAAEIIKKNPSLKIEIQGHTDNRGSERYNKQLSENRAKAVMKYLVEKGIEQDRLKAEGFGFSRPTATNKTPEGRAENRRVELKVIR